MVLDRLLPRGWLVVIVGTLLATACGHGGSTAARIRRLDAQERQLRASVESLEGKQETLRAEVQKAQTDADNARCRAEQEGYRAVVASIYADHATRVAEYKGCKAKAAKKGGGLAALGCGLAAFATGGVALALCGGGLAVGYAVSESGCSEEPPDMTPEDLRRIAAVMTGQPREPMCNGVASAAVHTSRPFRTTGRSSQYGGQAATQPASGRLGDRLASPLWSAPKSPREIKREERRHRRELRKLKRQQKRQIRATKRERKAP